MNTLLLLLLLSVVPVTPSSISPRSIPPRRVLSPFLYKTPSKHCRPTHAEIRDHHRRWQEQERKLSSPPRKTKRSKYWRREATIRSLETKKQTNGTTQRNDSPRSSVNLLQVQRDSKGSSSSYTSRLLHRNSVFLRSLQP